MSVLSTPQWKLAQIVAPADTSAWAAHDVFVVAHQYGTLQQTSRWAAFQATFPDRRVEGVFALSHSGSEQWRGLLVSQQLPGGWSYLLAPRGGLFVTNPVSETLRLLAQQLRMQFPRALFLRIDPPFPVASDAAAQFLALQEDVRTRPAPETTPTTTLLLDLHLDEDALLAQMHPKGRYNIKVAAKHGVTCRAGTRDDLPGFSTLLRQTAERTGIAVHAPPVYAAMLEALGDAAALRIAEIAGTPIAAMITTQFAGTTTYYYGASDHAARQTMAPYALQWDAIRAAKAAGDQWYDFLGIAPEGSTRHRLAGVTDFKRKFGGILRVETPPVDLVLRPLLAHAFHLTRHSRSLFRRRVP